MLRHLGKQLLRYVITLLAVALVANLLVELMPGDPAAIAVGELAGEEQIELVRERLRLDEPVHERFAAWLADAVTGDLSTSSSVQRGRSVADMITERLPITLSVAGLAMVFALLVSIPAGVYAALRRGTWVDRVITATGSIALGVPSFVIGLLLVKVVALDRGLFPATGYSKFSEEGFTEWLRHIVLPSIALASLPAAEFARQVRGAMIDSFEREYVRTARAVGMPRWKVIYKYAAKAAAPALVTVAGLQFASLLGGIVLLERVFLIPGFGSLAFDAVTLCDVSLIQGIVLIGAVLVLTVNLFVDALNTYLVPRARQ